MTATKPKRKNQEQRVLARLLTGEKLNMIEAWYHMHITQLQTRVCYLRKEGYPIIGEKNPNATYFDYWLDPKFIEDYRAGKVLGLQPNEPINQDTNAPIIEQAA